MILIAGIATYIHFQVKPLDQLYTEWEPKVRNWVNETFYAPDDDTLNSKRADPPPKSPAPPPESPNEVQDNRIQNWIEKAEKAYDAGERDQAISLSNKVIEKDEKNVKALRIRAISNVDQIRYKEAIPDYDRLIRINKRDGDAFYYRGLCYEMTNDEAQACKDYHSANAYGVTDAIFKIQDICNKRDSIAPEEDLGSDES